MTRPVRPLRRAVPHLGQPGGVGVVDDVDVAAGGVGEQRVGVGADPGAVDVGRRADHAVADDGRHRHADRPARVGEPAEQLDEHLGDGLRGRRLRGLDPHPVLGEVALVEVDRRPLDAEPPKSMPKGWSSMPPISLIRQGGHNRSDLRRVTLDGGPERDHPRGSGRNQHDPMSEPPHRRRPGGRDGPRSAAPGRRRGAARDRRLCRHPELHGQPPVRRQGTTRGRGGRSLPHRPGDQRRRHRVPGPGGRRRGSATSTARSEAPVRARPRAASWRCNPATRSRPSCTGATPVRSRPTSATPPTPRWSPCASRRSATPGGCRSGRTSARRRSGRLR